MSAATTDRADYAAKITSAYRQNIKSVLTMGRLLNEAKDWLGPNEFKSMVTHDLPFVVRTAERLIDIAINEVLSNPTHESNLPAGWTTLYLLTKLPIKVLKACLADGTITAKITRQEVTALIKHHCPKRRADPTDRIKFQGEYFAKCLKEASQEQQIRELNEILRRLGLIEQGFRIVRASKKEAA